MASLITPPLKMIASAGLPLRQGVAMTINTDDPQRQADVVLGDQDVALLWLFGEVRATTPGDVLFDVRDPGYAIVVLLSGRVGLVDRSHGGEIFILVTAFATNRQRLMRSAAATLTLIGTEASRGIERLQKFGTRNRISYRCLDPEDPVAVTLLTRFAPGERTDVCVVRGQRILADPSRYYYDKIRSDGTDEIVLSGGQPISLHEARTVVARRSTSGSGRENALVLQLRDGLELATVDGEDDVDALVSALEARGAVKSIMTLRAAIGRLGAERSRAPEPRDSFEAVSNVMNAGLYPDCAVVAHRATERAVQMPLAIVDQLRRSRLIAFRKARGNGYFDLSDQGNQMIERLAHAQY